MPGCRLNDKTSFKNNIALSAIYVDTSLAVESPAHDNGAVNDTVLPNIDRLGNLFRNKSLNSGC